MATAIPFDRNFDPPYGVIERLAPGLRRIVARNPGPLTFRGTATFIIGEGNVAVIDPGPDVPDHISALLAGLGTEAISHILVTHTHLDHSPAAAAQDSNRCTDLRFWSARSRPGRYRGWRRRGFLARRYITGRR